MPRLFNPFISNNFTKSQPPYFPVFCSVCILFVHPTKRFLFRAGFEALYRFHAFFIYRKFSDLMSIVVNDRFKAIFIGLARQLNSCLVRCCEAQFYGCCEAQFHFQGERNMLETIIVVLVVLWLIGFVGFSASVGNLIHILLVLALVVLVIRLFSGRRVV